MIFTCEVCAWQGVTNPQLRRCPGCRKLARLCGGCVVTWVACSPECLAAWRKEAQTWPTAYLEPKRALKKKEDQGPSLF